MKRFCVVEGCDERSDAFSYCTKHYYRYRTHGDPLMTLHRYGGHKHGTVAAYDLGCQCERCADAERVADEKAKERLEKKGHERRVCEVEGCGHRHVAYGLCQKHYSRWRRHGDPLMGVHRYGQHRHGTVQAYILGCRCGECLTAWVGPPRPLVGPAPYTVRYHACPDWTRKSCPSCGVPRLMPVDADECGRCLDRKEKRRLGFPKRKKQGAG